MWKGTKLSNLRSTITNMELHNLKSGAPHVELCGYIIELWYSAILGFCSHIKTVGSQILRARVKWLSRYLALSREGHNSGIQDHRPALANSMLSDNRGTYVSRISTHRHRTSDKSQQATLDFNNHATKLSNHTLCKATHDGFCVEISQTTSRLDRKQNWLHACAVGPARPGSPKLDELLGDKFSNRISNKISTFSTQ